MGHWNCHQQRYWTRKAEEKIEIAKELLKMKLNDEDIVKATGLTSNEIMQLKEDK